MSKSSRLPEARSASGWCGAAFMPDPCSPVMAVCPNEIAALPGVRAQPARFLR
jgi:hypothetical protein